ncbi:MAG: DUF2551 domain-containing protein [Archaeoglobaceae archaeon]
MDIGDRVRKYLEKDKKGVRRELLLLLLDGRKHISDDIYEVLKAKGYEINKKSVSAMLGVVSSKLGIVKMELGERKKYYIKPEYRELLREMLESTL